EATGLGSGRDVHVVSLDADHHAAARCGERAVDFLDQHGIRATLHAESCEPHTAERIMEHAYKLHAGLLVMGAYGKPFVTECVLGSVTRTLLAHSSIPLFLYH